MPLYPALDKNFDSSKLYKEIILHFQFQVAELDINKQNHLITKISVKYV